jgi:hypothetical protein
LTFLGLGFHAADVEPGDWRGVSAGLGCEFFFAVQDAVAGVLDDDDELPGVAGTELHGLLVDHDRAVGRTRRRAATDPAASTGLPSRRWIAALAGSGPAWRAPRMARNARSWGNSRDATVRST